LAAPGLFPISSEKPSLRTNSQHKIHICPQEYVDLLVGEMIPAVAKQGIARFCDLFCEKSVFSVDQGRRILEAAAEAGMGLKIHAGEIHDLGGATLAA
jgi:imidazolonepropionase